MVWVNQFNYGSNFFGLKKIKIIIIIIIIRLCIGSNHQNSPIAFKKNGKTFWTKLEKCLG